MKTVVFFTPQSLSNVGGGERVLAIIANSLSSDYKVKVLTPYISNSYFKYNQNIEIINFGLKPTKNKYKRRLILVRILYELNRFINREKFDTFISFSVLGSILTLYSTIRFRNAHFFSWIHTSFFHPFHPILKHLFLWRVKLFHKLIVLNTLDAQIYARYHSKVIILPNPNPVSAKQVSDLTQKRILSLGRLDKEKGFDYLINICSKVFQKKKDWCLDIYGQDDGEKANLGKIIKSRNMQGRINLFPPQNDVDSIYRSASIFAFTSLFESFGLVLIEANSYGLPIVTFNSPSSIKDIIHDGENGFLIDQFDEIGFENRLLELIDSYELRKKMGENGIRSSKKYDISKIKGKWIELLECKKLS